MICMLLDPCVVPFPVFSGAARSESAVGFKNPLYLYIAFLFNMYKIS